MISDTTKWEFGIFISQLSLTKILDTIEILILILPMAICSMLIFLKHNFIHKTFLIIFIGTIISLWS